MARRKADWSILRGTLIGFTLCVVIAGAMVSASLYFKQSMEREYRVHHSRFRDASQQYLAVDEEERIIEEFYPDFVRLYRAGLIGPERRLSWLEALRKAGPAIRMPELNYKLDARRVWQPDFQLALGSYTLHASTMNLSLGLLHEGDLLALFALLDRDALGQYSVRSCELRAPEGEITLDPRAVNIRTECKLDWLTIDLGGGRELTL
jgi:hypothetical protein